MDQKGREGRKKKKKQGQSTGIVKRGEHGILDQGDSNGIAGIYLEGKIFTKILINFG